MIDTCKSDFSYFSDFRWTHTSMASLDEKYQGYKLLFGSCLFFKYIHAFVGFDASLGKKNKNKIQAHYITLPWAKISIEPFITDIKNKGTNEACNKCRGGGSKTCVFLLYFLC